MTEEEKEKKRKEYLARLCDQFVLRKILSMQHQG